MKTFFLFGGLLLGGLVLAQNLTYSLSINNKAYSSSAIVIKGETYVPLKALQAAGVRSSLSGGRLSLTLPSATANAAGGAKQVAALEGCIGEWLFNGIWRIRVTEPLAVTGDRIGATYKFEFRNGTNKSGFAPSGTGFKGIQLALNDGTTTSAVYVNDLSDPPYLAGASHSQVVEFFWEGVERTPSRLIVLFDPNDEYYKLGTVKFTVQNPSLRIKTDCKK
jgi:hypothetical protein